MGDNLETGSCKPGASIIITYAMLYKATGMCKALFPRERKP